MRLVVDVDVEIDACGWRCMVVIVPFTRVVVVVIIVMGFVTAWQRENHGSDQKGRAEKVFYFLFHDALL